MENIYYCDFGECPCGAMYSEDCRVFCGLGVDEDEYPYEEDYVSSDELFKEMDGRRQCELSAPAAKTNRQARENWNKLVSK